MKMDDGRTALDIVVEKLAYGLLPLSPGNWLNSFEEYSRAFGFSTGTIKNAFRQLEQMGAVKLSRHGQAGQKLEEMDWIMLQKVAGLPILTGLFPLDSVLAIAVEKKLAPYSYATLYCSDDSMRLALVQTGKVDFALVPYSLAKGAGDTVQLALDLSFSDGDPAPDAPVLIANRGDSVAVTFLKRNLWPEDF